MPRASIIISTAGRPDSLRSTLAALARVDIPAGISAELIVVANDSSDATAAAIREAHFENLQLKFLSEPRPGKSRALNRALAEAAGDIILFTDDDVIPARDWIAKICAPILDGTADAVTGCIRVAPHLARPWMSGAHLSWLADTAHLDSRTPGSLVGANMAISRAVFDRIPRFDLELGPGALGYGEDTLFGWQIIAAGYRLTGAFDAVVEHHFLENRLLPDGWFNAARKMGRIDAYIGHHWENSLWPHSRRALCTAFLRLAWYRLIFHFSSPGDVVSESLLNATRSFHARLHYLHERKRPRNYDRHGLVKRLPQSRLSPPSGAVPLTYCVEAQPKA